MIHSVVSKLLISKFFFTFNKTYPILKFTFTSNLFNIILIENAKDIKLFPWTLLRYNQFSKILFIFLSVKKIKLDNVFETMFNNSYLDVLAIQYPSFEISEEIYALDIKWKTTFSESYSRKEILFYNHKTTTYFKKRFKNMNETYLYFLRTREFPRSEKYTSNTPIGYVGNILYQFSKSVNARLHYTRFSDSLENSQHMEQIHNKDSIHFGASFKSFINFKRDLHGIRKLSTVLELMPWLIIVPKPKSLQYSKYILKPFSSEVWFLAFLVIFLASFVPRGNFGKNFTDFFRASLSQSYNFQKSYKISKIHLLIVFFGFVMTIWYSSLIGSFATTTLHEKPLKTLRDIKKSGLKILTEDFENKVFSNSKAYKNKKIFRNVSRNEFFKLGNSMNDSFGYLEYGDRWEYYYKPRMIFQNKINFVETDIVLGYFPVFLQMKEKLIFRRLLNDFLYKIRDVGLYQRWTKGAFLDAVKYKLENGKINFTFANFQRFKAKSPIRPIDITFIQYGIFIFFIGILISGIVFVFESFYNIKIIIIFRYRS